MKIRQIHSCALPMVLSIAFALVPTSAQAEPSASARETARCLVIAGRAKLEAGDHAGALQALKAAHDIMGVPTTGLDLARAQAAGGLLIEARTTALAVTRMPAKPSEPEAFSPQRVLPGETPSRAAGSAGTAGSVPTWVWVAGGAGLAALGAGVAFGIDYANVNAKVKTDCPGNVCDANKYTVESAQALASRWNRDLGLLIGCSAVGAIGVSAAIVRIGWAPRRQELPAPAKSAVVAPLLSPSLLGAVVQGKF